MPIFTKAEHATLAPLIAALAAAKAAVATAGDVTAEADAQHVALLAKIAALGSEPQPNDFETSASWQTAQAEHRFKLAKLQSDIAPAAAKVDAARAAFDAALPAVQNAQNVILQADAGILGARVEVINDLGITAAVQFRRAHEKVPVGYSVDHPRGLSFQGMGYGMVAIALGRTVDIATIAAD